MVLLNKLVVIFKLADKVLVKKFRYYDNFAILSTLRVRCIQVKLIAAFLEDGYVNHVLIDTSFFTPVLSYQMANF